MKHSPNLLALAIALIGLPGAVWAQDEAQLSTVIVEGKQSAGQGVFQAAEITAKDIQKNNAVDLKTALKNLPGVEVVGLQGARQGNDSVNIRGLSGNRVAMKIDGIDLPEAQETKFFSASGSVFGRGEFVDPTSFGRVGLKKYAGAFALAGSVDIHTLSAAEVLNGERFGGWVETGYNGVDHSAMTSGAVAAAAGAWRGMLLGTYRNGSETINQGRVGGAGKTRTESNPQDYNSRYLLTSHDVQLNDEHALNVSAEYFKRNVWTDNQSGLSSATLSDHAKDATQRKRLSVAHHYNSDAGLVRRVDTQVYWQKATTDNARYRQTYSARTGIGERIDLAETSDRVWGVDVSAASHFENPLLTQDWRYGVQYAHHTIENNLDSTYASLGMFSNAKQTKANVFLEGDLDFGAWMVSPGVAVSHYRYTPQATDDYKQAADFANPVTGQSKTLVSPKLALAWQVHPLLTPYLTYARGFKAPSSQQLVSSFGNSTAYYSYAIVGNPQLKPETSHNFEYGFKGHSDVFSYQINGFYNRYKNFIDYVNMPELAAAHRYTFLYQYRNVDKATIKGLEAQAQWRFNPNWRLDGALTYAKGTVDTEGERNPLNSVNPLKFKLGLAYEQETWGADVHLTYVAKKADKDIDVSPSAWSINPSKSYALVDLGAYWQPNKHLSLNAGVNNLFDKKYWNWADISSLAFKSSTADYNGMAGSSSVMTPVTADRYTAPGRHFNIGLRYTF